MKKVIIGMSGGVDSSVAAYLLKKDGYEVIGITFNLNDNSSVDAKLVCKRLGIEHHTIDLRNEFKKEIIDTFINAYKIGLTPNPCCLCNRKIKMKYLYDLMKEYNCDYIATGHYAKIVSNKLMLGADLNKDQTYFLAGINKDIIPHIIFPLYDINKDEVRRIAEECNLETAYKKDSYDVCFIDDKFKDFIKSKINSYPGDIVDIETKEVVGKHDGLGYYTIGQRRGLNLGGNKEKSYVAMKDLDNNILYVASGDENKYLYSSEAIIEDFNFLSDLRPSKCTCKFRYRQKDIDIEVEYLDNNMLKLKYDNAKAVTPGQFCVLYLDDIVLGGGIIKEIK